jgi:pyruvate kinase
VPVGPGLRAPTAESCRRTSLYWGVHALQIETEDRLDDLERQIQSQLRNLGIVQRGDMVVLTGGHPIYRFGPTNFLKILPID